MRLALICGCLCLIRFAPPAAAQSVAPGGPEANPGRPTVSTPATLTPVDYLQFETGELAANHSPEFSSRYGFNEVIKFSVVSRLELLAAADLIARSTPTEDRKPDGRLFLGCTGGALPGRRRKTYDLQRAIFIASYDGALRNSISAVPRILALLLASADVKAFTTTQTRSSTNSFKAVRRAQFGQTLSISHRSAGKLTLPARSGTLLSLSSGNAVGNLWAVGYSCAEETRFGCWI